MPSSSDPAHGRAQADRSVKAATTPSEASLAAVLLYGLTLDDDDPVLGVLLGARRELGLVASLGKIAKPGADFDLAELVPVLESIGRRLGIRAKITFQFQIPFVARRSRLAGCNEHGVPGS